MDTAHPFEEIVTTPARFREIVKAPSRFVANKVIDRVDELCRRFIEAAPFAVIASTNAAGAVDLSPKGDPAGFVHVLDPHTLAIPDRPGNNRADTMSNLLEDARIGLIFLVPGKRETLRVSGRGSIVRDSRLNRRLAHGRREPDLAIVVNVDRAFFHCSKCMIRSRLWEPDAWGYVAGLPTLGETMQRHGQLADDLDAIEGIVRQDAEKRLY